MGKPSTFADRALALYQGLQAPQGIPADVAVMNPYQDPAVMQYARQFLEKYFSDNRQRVLVFGINPGRFGAGTIGITFTDPIALANECGIPNDLPRARELSSVFVYEFIKHWGGPDKFYQDFFMSAVSPLGFTKGGVNYNYYDDPRLLVAVKPFIIETMRGHIALGAKPSAIIFGTGKNAKFFNQLNTEHGFFENVYVLEHPRFIMQYRRKQLSDYLKKYREVFAKAVG